MKKIFFLPLFFVSVNLFSQINKPDNTLSIKVNNMGLSDFVESYFHANFHPKLDTLGISGMSWVKISIDSNAKLLSVECDPTTNKTLENFIREVLTNAGSKWVINGNKSLLSGTNQIILPIYYTLQYDGKTKDTPMLSGFRLNKYFRERADTGNNVLLFLPPVEYISPFDESGKTWKKANSSVKKKYGNK
jgi:hypothetical protein